MRKDIFRYKVGHKTMAADPLVIQRRLMGSNSIDLEIDFKLAMTQSKEGVMALGRLIDAAREAFKLPEYEEDDKGNELGVTDGDVLDIMISFAQFMDDLKKKAENGPTWQNSTVLKSSEPSTTRSTSDCGSIESVPSYGERLRQCLD